MTSTTSRLLDLLSLLQTKRDWPGGLLAERMQVSRRTVRRDVDRLRELGYRIEATMGPDGGYRLDAGSELPPLLFDEDQAVALAVALQASTVAGVGVEEAALRALTTVRQVMPSHLRHRIDSLQITTLARQAEAQVSADVLVALSTAIRAREVLRFDYASAESRRVEPHHIVTSQGLWYLVGWDLDRGDWRTFRADRISPRVPTGPRFTPREVPGGDVHEFVSARFKGSDVNAWPCRGSVILELPARDVIPFAGDGVVVEIDRNRCRLEAGAWSWNALAASFGRFDAAMQVIGPQELVDAFAELGARYSGADGPR